MQSPDHRQAADFSAGPAAAEHGPDATLQAAQAVVFWWRAVGDALAPVLGQRGVGALYQRTLHLAAGTHPFLSSADSPGTDLDLPALQALQALLAEQTDAAVGAAGATLAATLSSLLEGLVGPSLTERLLHEVQAPTTGGHPAQDTSR